MYDEFPLMKKIIDKKIILKRLDNIKYFIDNFYYNEKNIKLLNIYNSGHINDINILSYYDETKYFKYWNKNKNRILNTSKDKNNLIENSISLYKNFNNDCILYFSTTIIALCNKYKLYNILDINMTTLKRLLGSCIRNFNYYGIINKNNKKLAKKILKKYGNDNQKLIKNIKVLNNNKELNKEKGINIIIYDIVSKKLSDKKLEKYFKILDNKGVFIIIYEKNRDDKIKDNILEKYDNEIINFNNIKMKTYFKTKQKKEIIKNKKKYLIFSKYFDKLQNNFPKNWIEAKDTNNIDFLYMDSIFSTDKLIYSIYSKTKSKGLFNKDKSKDFNDKSILHNYVKKDNLEIFKKYFMDQYDINNLNNLNQYKKKYNYLFKKHKHWIVKPEPGGQGIGIRLFDNLDKLLKYVKEYDGTFYGKKTKKWVLQKYISNPLLIPKTMKKFHLRFYYFVSNINNKLDCYIYMQGCFYPSKYKYTLNNLDFDVHDTHGSATKIKEKGFFPQYFKKLYGNKNTKKVYNDIINIFTYISSIIDFNCFKPDSKNCFHLIGTDIMINDNFETKLIELNMEPGFRPFMWFPKKGKEFQKELIYITTNHNINKIKNFIKVN